MIVVAGFNAGIGLKYYIATQCLFLIEILLINYVRQEVIQTIFFALMRATFLPAHRCVYP